MGLMTLEEFRDDVHALLDNRTDITPGAAGESRDRLDRCINFAYRQATLPSVFRHPALDSSQDIILAASTSDYALSSDLYAIEAVYLIEDDGHERRIVARNFPILLESRFITTNATGRPSRYARRGQRIYFNQQPNTDLVGNIVTVYYLARPTALSDPDDPTVIEEFWDQYIVFRAAGYLWQFFGQQQKADYFREAAASLANEAIENYDLDAADPTDGSEIDTEVLRSYT